MTETVPGPTPQRRSDKQAETTSTSLTAAGMGAFLLWIFGMIDAGRFFVPPVETAMFMGAGMLPIIHAIGARWVKKLSYVDGVNGRAPAGPREADLVPDPKTTV